MQEVSYIRPIVTHFDCEAEIARSINTILQVTDTGFVDRNGQLREVSFELLDALRQDRQLLKDRLKSRPTPQWAMSFEELRPRLKYPGLRNAPCEVIRAAFAVEGMLKAA